MTLWGREHRITEVTVAEGRGRRMGGKAKGMERSLGDKKIEKKMDGFRIGKGRERERENWKGI